MAKIYMVTWSATYEDYGIHSAHRTAKGAKAEADAQNAREAVETKGRISRNWYEVEEMDLQP